jgi:hypothetical protein
VHLASLAVRAAAVAIVLACAHAASAQDAGKPDNATCLGCHGTPGFAAPRTDGQTRPLFVSAEQFAQSVHGKALKCTDCHTTMTAVPFALLLPIGRALPHGHVWPALIAFPPALLLIQHFIHVPRGRQFKRVLVQTVQVQSLFSLLLALGLVL